jgi:hypothetical protein
LFRRLVQFQGSLIFPFGRIVVMARFGEHPEVHMGAGFGFEPPHCLIQSHGVTEQVPSLLHVTLGLPYQAKIVPEGRFSWAIIHLLRQLQRLRIAPSRFRQSPRLMLGRS